MATKNKTAGKKLLDGDQIVSLYVKSVLENNHPPQNIYLFCKENNIEEPDFYAFFGSFENLRQTVWLKFFENAKTAIGKEPAYATYSNKNKLLALYFTLFEILTLNRSYILYSLKENKEGLKNLLDLKLFRNDFKDYISELIKSDNAVMQTTKIHKIANPVFSEGAWIQFLFILKFWMDDNSKGFEKTDIVIEKSVNTVVDLLDTKPLENLIDLGKFLWKEGKMR
jgi:hypothetical protein